jgi:hypothetical protein
VALSDFTFTNTLLNIPTDITIPIRSTWYNRVDNTGPSFNFAITEITIPQGQYTQQQMLAFLNNNFPVFSDTLEENFVTDTCYGLGLSPDIEAPVNVVPNNTKFVISQSETALAQAYVGNGLNSHEYSSFSLISNENNYRWFVMMGLKPIPNSLVTLPNFDPITIPVQLFSKNYDPVDNLTTCTYQINVEITGLYSYDFSGSKMIYFFLDSPVSSHFRAPFDQCAESNILGSVPTAWCAYGYQSSYTVQNLAWAVQKNLTMSNVQIALRDEYRELVNFQNIPWMASIRVKFALSEDEPMVNALDGSVGSINSLSTLHPTAQPYSNGAGRDLLGIKKKSRAF